jgi:hypothetical protein
VLVLKKERNWKGKGKNRGRGRTYIAAAAVAVVVHGDGRDVDGVAAAGAGDALLLREAVFVEAEVLGVALDGCAAVVEGYRQRCSSKRNESCWEGDGGAHLGCREVFIGALCCCV